MVHCLPGIASNIVHRHEWWRAAYDAPAGRLRKILLLDGVLDLLACLLETAGRLIHLPLSLERLVIRDLAGRFFCVPLDHLAGAYVNLAKLCLREKNFLKAETLMGKAVSVDPNNAESLMLLADAQYMDHHYEAAIASARQAHASSNTHPAFVHYIAAREIGRAHV